MKSVKHTISALQQGGPVHSQKDYGHGTTIGDDNYALSGTIDIHYKRRWPHKGGELAGYDSLYPKFSPQWCHLYHN